MQNAELDRAFVIMLPGLLPSPSSPFNDKVRNVGTFLFIYEINTCITIRARTYG